MVSSEIRAMDIWTICENNTIFPKPTRDESIKSKFQFIGTFIAKSIIDQRHTDVPFNSLFWEIVLGSKPHMRDIKNIVTPSFYQTLEEFKQIVEKKKSLKKDTSMDKDE
jgi:hypothetical protein